MHIVRTSGVSDGLQFAEVPGHGFFIPVSAIENGTVMVVDNGVADIRTVTVSDQDATMAYITDGLNDGDKVILSNVKAGEKVKVVRK